MFVRRELPQSRLAPKPDTTVCSVNPARPKPERPCFYCLKSGHLIADNEAWKEKQRSSSKQQQGIGTSSSEALTREIP